MTCREGPCPEGLACVDMLCVTPVDAAPDDMDAPDGPPPALTCADPGIIDPLGGSDSGNTMGRMNLVKAMCGGFVNNGLDVVYKMDVPSGTNLTVAISLGTRKAYVLSQCQEFPPQCLGNARAVMGSPIAVTTTTRPSFIVVDDESGSDAGGAYTVNVSLP